jgi:hypothetical protein
MFATCAALAVILAAGLPGGSPKRGGPIGQGHPIINLDGGLDGVKPVPKLFPSSVHRPVLLFSASPTTPGRFRAYAIDGSNRKLLTAVEGKSAADFPRFWKAATAEIAAIAQKGYPDFDLLIAGSILIVEEKPPHGEPHGSTPPGGSSTEKKVSKQTAQWLGELFDRLRLESNKRR